MNYEPDKRDLFGPIIGTPKWSTPLNLRERYLPFSSRVIFHFSDDLFGDHLRDSNSYAHKCIGYLPNGIMNPQNSRVLYHYTSGENFRSIISSKELWASKVGSMNDHSEISYVRELFLIQLSNLLSERQDEKKILKTIQKLFDENICKNYYQISFSKRANLLSQWTRYAGESGFSIGFSEEIFKHNRKVSSSWRLIDIEYDVKVQVEAIKEVAARIVPYLNQKSDLSTKLFLDNCKESLDNMALKFKQPGFREEEEVRLVIQVENESDPQIKNNSQRNYYPFNFKQAFQNCELLDLDFEYIFSSPCQDCKSKMKEIFEYLHKAKLKFRTIVDSGIPYNWA